MGKAIKSKNNPPDRRVDFFQTFDKFALVRFITGVCEVRSFPSRLPVFPNWFPFNDMLLDGHLRLGEFGVKTRSWNWDYRGPVLLYNSGRTACSAMRAYHYRDSREHHGVIIGVGNLVQVRELTEAETLQMICNFNNISKRMAALLGPYLISPFQFGFFFQDLRRFKESVPFRWPSGPIKPIWTRIRRGSKLAYELEKTQKQQCKVSPVTASGRKGERTWLEEILQEVQAETDSWPPWMRREAGL